MAHAKELRTLHKGHKRRYTQNMPKGPEKELSKTTQSPNQDYIKDKQDISSILSILDSLIIRTNPFGANISGDNSYRRAERITAALHIITNHVPEEEPIRNIIRNKGIELLSLILDLRTGLRGAASEKGQTVLAIIRELISLVRLLAVSGFVSIQNANTLAEAFDELGSLITVSQRSTLAEQLTISHEQLIPPTTSSQSRTDRVSLGSVSYIKKTNQKSADNIPRVDYLDTTQRSSRIIDILKLGGVLGIKDISSNLPQYSEKMVQRELAELVDSGKVRKIGSKRWSKYQSV